MSPELLNAYSKGNPIRELYQKAINAAQNGKPDNDYKQYRYYILHQILAQSVRRFPYLNVVECGCWHGHSTILTAEVMKAEGATGKLHVFDSFKGLSEFRKQDMSSYQPTPTAREAERVHYASDMGRLQKLVEPYGFVELHKGWIPTVFEGVDVGRVSFATIDVDLFEPTLDSLAFVYPRLMPGGMVFFDDYGYNCFPGAKKAVDKYLGADFEGLFIENPMGSAYLIKK